MEERDGLSLRGWPGWLTPCPPPPPFVQALATTSRRPATPGCSASCRPPPPSATWWVGGLPLNCGAQLCACCARAARRTRRTRLLTTEPNLPPTTLLPPPTQVTNPDLFDEGAADGAVKNNGTASIGCGLGAAGGKSMAGLAAALGAPVPEGGSSADAGLAVEKPMGSWLLLARLGEGGEHAALGWGGPAVQQLGRVALVAGGCSHAETSPSPHRSCSSPDDPLAVCGVQVCAKPANATTPSA